MKARALVAWNLRQLRTSAGLSQEMLASDADVDASYISRLERSLENVSIGVLERLADRLGVGIIELFRPIPDKLGPPPPLPGGRPRRKG